MGLAAFNRMRRELAKAKAEVIPPPPATSETKSATPPDSVADISAALKLINSAEQPTELAPLPGIGKGAGRIILNKRPEGGYQAIAQIQELCPELGENPFRIDWAAVETWEK